MENTGPEPSPGTAAVTAAPSASGGVLPPPQPPPPPTSKSSGENNEPASAAPSSHPPARSRKQTFDPEVLRSPLEDDHEGGNGPKAAPTTTTGGIKVGGTGGASVEPSTSLDSGPSSGNGANQQQGESQSPPSTVQAVHEPDILEEDLDDMEYVPYKKERKGSKKGAEFISGLLCLFQAIFFSQC